MECLAKASVKICTIGEMPLLYKYPEGCRVFFGGNIVSVLVNSVGRVRHCDAISGLDETSTVLGELAEIICMSE